MTLPSKKEEKGIKWGKLNFIHFVVDFVRPVHWQHFLAAPGLFQVLCQFYVIMPTKPFEKKCRTYLLFSQSILVFVLLLKAHDRTFMLCNRLQWFFRGSLFLKHIFSLAQIGFCIINSFLPFSVDGQLLFGEFIVCFAWTFLEKWWWLREFLPLTFLKQDHLPSFQSPIKNRCLLLPWFCLLFVIKSAIFPNSSYHSHNYVEIDLPTKLRNFGGEL